MKPYDFRGYCWDTTRCLEEIDQPYFTADFKSLAARFKASKLPEYEQCRQLCEKVLAHARPSRELIRQVLLSIIRELHQIDMDKAKRYIYSSTLDSALGKIAA